MPESRRWLMAGALGIATAAFWAGRLAPARPPPPAEDRGDESGGGGREGDPQSRRRRVAADTGRGRTLVLFGLPAAGRAALMVKTLLARPEAVTVPRPVTDRPESDADPTGHLFRYLSEEQLTSEHNGGRLVGLHRRGAHRYALPIDWDGVKPGEPPLRLVKAPLGELPRLRRICDAADRGSERIPSGGTEDAEDNISDLVIISATDATENQSIPGTTSSIETHSQNPTTNTTSNHTDSPPPDTQKATGISTTTPIVNHVVDEPPSAATRPLLVLINVSHRTELAARLALRDALEPSTAEQRVRSAETELTAALAGDSFRRCFDAVISNDSLDKATERLLRFIDAELSDGTVGIETNGEGGTISPVGT